MELPREEQVRRHGLDVPMDHRVYPQAEHRLQNLPLHHLQTSPKLPKTSKMPYNTF